MLEPVDDTLEHVASALLIVTVFSIILSLAFNPIAGFGWAILMCYFCIKTWTSFNKENNGLVEISNDTDISQFSWYLIRAGLEFGNTRSFFGFDLFWGFSDKGCLAKASIGIRRGFNCIEGFFRQRLDICTKGR